MWDRACGTERVGPSTRDQGTGEDQDPSQVQVRFAREYTVVIEPGVRPVDALDLSLVEARLGTEGDTTGGLEADVAYLLRSSGRRGATGRDARVRSPPEREEHGPAKAEPGPEIVEANGLLHVEDGEGHEHG
jgi:hypothetical protein